MSLLKDELIDLFIAEVKKRPALYQKNLEDYSDQNKKRKLWEGVCAAVVPKWFDLNSDQKAQTVHEIQKRWLNLRTCFGRELKAQKSENGSFSKRRKYIYFDQLLFLLPSVEPRTKPKNSDTTVKHIELEKVEIKQDTYEDFDIEQNDDETVNTATSTLQRKRKLSSSLQEKYVEEEVEKSSQKSEIIDDDTHFALSIVPSLRDLTEDEKLDAKIQILYVFKQIRMARFSEGHSSSYSNQDPLTFK